jgi:hypothetical protein
VNLNDTAKELAGIAISAVVSCFAFWQFGVLIGGIGTGMDSALDSGSDIECRPKRIATMATLYYPACKTTYWLFKSRDQ